MFKSVLNLLSLSKDLNFLNIKYSGLGMLFKTPDFSFKSQNESKPKKLLFIIIFESHLKHFLSIVDELEKNNIPYSIIPLNKFLTNGLKKFEERIISLDSYIKIYEIPLSIILHVFNYLTFLFSSNVLMKNSTLKLYKRYYFIRSAFNRSIKSSDIKKIILFKGDGLEAFTITLAVKKIKPNIQLISIQHGLIRTSDQFKFLRIDEFWVWSDFYKSRLKKLNIKYKIRKVGDPSKDKKFNKPLFEKKKREIKKIIFFPNHGNSHTNKSQILYSIKIISHFITDYKRINLFVKPHPGDVNDFVKLNLKTNKRISLIDKNKNVNINSFDLVLINNSEIGNESALNGIPILILAEDKSQIMVEQYLDYRVAELATNKREIEQKIKKIERNYISFQVNCRKFIDLVYSYKGKSSKRIIELLNEK